MRSRLYFNIRERDHQIQEDIYPMKVIISNIQNDNFNQVIQPYVQIVFAEPAEELGPRLEKLNSEIVSEEPEKRDQQNGTTLSIQTEKISAVETSSGKTYADAK